MARIKKEASPFVTMCSFGYSQKGLTLKGALTSATKTLQRDEYRTPEFVGIYQLVKVVRRELTPVIVEDVACCDKIKGAK